MSCEKFDERFQQLLDQRLEPANDRELRLHADHCGECRSLLDAQLQLLSAFGRDFHADRLPEDFAEQVVAQVVSERPRQKTWERKVWAAALLAVAALLFLAFVPAWRGPSNAIVSRPPSDERDVKSSVVKSNIVKSSVDTVPVTTQTKVVPTVGQEIASVQGTGDWIDSLRESISEVSLENLEPMDQIADGFRPVATSLQSAVGVLRRTLPGGGESRTKPMPDTSGMWNTEFVAHV